MAKWKMSHRTVLGQYIVVYSQFVDHNVFNVKIKHIFQNTSVDALMKEYTKTGFASHDEVVEDAFKEAEKFLQG